MAVRTVPAKFKTSDGQEYDTAAEAERHEQLIEAKEKFDNARHALGQLLVESQVTADGRRFELNMWHSYWHVSEGWAGLPALSKVDFAGYRFDYEGEDDDLVILNGYPEKTRRYRIRDLYWNETAAQVALLAAQDAWLVERAAEVEKLRQKLGDVRA